MLQSKYSTCCMCMLTMAHCFIVASFDRQKYEHYIKLHLSAVICPGDEVRRYLSGLLVSEGSLGAGAAGEFTGGYSVQEIATYVFNIMNRKYSCTNGKLEPGCGVWPSLNFLVLFISERGIARGPPGPPGPQGPPGPSGSGGSGFTTATIDYSALMRSEIYWFSWTVDRH